MAIENRVHLTKSVMVSSIPTVTRFTAGLKEVLCSSLSREAKHSPLQRALLPLNHGDILHFSVLVI